MNRHPPPHLEARASVSIVCDATNQMRYASNIDQDLARREEAPKHEGAKRKSINEDQPHH